MTLCQSCTRAGLGTCQSPGMCNLLSDGREQHRCRKCGAEMRTGIATGQTYCGGAVDFPGDDHPSTFAAGGPGKLITCRKCPECGWSTT